MNDFTSALVFVMVVILLVGTALGKILSGDSYGDDVEEAIAACEKSLPRDRHCVAVITAKEVKND